MPGRCQARLSWVHSLLVHICSSGMYIVTLWSYVHNFHNIHTGCCNWTGCLLLDSAQRPGNLKLKYVNHPAVYIRWDRVRPWSQRVLRPPWVCVTLLDLRTTQHYNLYPGCLKREGVKVSVLATDRSTSVRCVS